MAGLPDWTGRIVIDANNPIEAPLFKPVDLRRPRYQARCLLISCPERASSRRSIISAQKCWPLIHVRTAVGACCSIPATTAARRRRWRHSSKGIGFVGIDLGSLAVGGKLAQFPGGPLPNQNLVKVA